MIKQARPYLTDLMNNEIHPFDFVAVVRDRAMYFAVVERITPKGFKGWYIRDNNSITKSLVLFRDSEVMAIDNQKFALDFPNHYHVLTHAIDEKQTVAKLNQI